MCGLAGILTARPGNERDLHALRKMTRAVRHRGPDAEGFWQNANEGVALGHQRLAIVDLSDHGSQPMQSSDGRFVIVFNGEIYNYKDIRRQLTREHSISWKGNSDTEVLIEAIGAWGLSQTLDTIIGMFAFCVYDRKQRTVSLARDRFGEKPCYFSRIDSETFIFGSELRVIENYPDFRGEIDTGAVRAFMRLGHIPAAQCIYRNVARLPAASLLSFKPEQLARLPDTNGLLDSATGYWSAKDEYQQALTRRNRDSSAPDCDATSREVESSLSESIALRLKADVPVGVFLSGGVDSPTIAALAQSVTTQGVKTFSIGVQDDSINSFADASNEAQRAAAIAAKLGTDHHELHATSADAMAVAMKLTEIFDEPFADPSQIPTTLVSQLASQSVKVCLTGDGGDEMFAGYNRHVWIHRNGSRLTRLPRSVRLRLSASINRLSGYQWDRVYASVERFLPRTQRTTDPGEKLHKLAQALRCDTPSETYDSLIARNVDAEIWRHDFESDGQGYTENPILKNATATDHFQLWDMLGFMQNAILTKVDRASMHHSLETRLPFLDPSLVRLAMQLDPACKIKNNRGKHVLRQILRRRIPSLDSTQPKSGFVLPLENWLRTDTTMNAWASDLLAPDSLAAAGWANADHIAKLWGQHQRGTHNHVSVLWNMLMYMAWKTSSRERELA